MEPNRAVDIAEKLSQFDRHWTPHRIATFDQHQLVVAKVQGEFVWHAHEHHDEVFLPVSGTLWIDLEGDRCVSVGPGQVYVVPAGVRHRPHTRDGEEVHLLLIDPLDVQHTGEEVSERTVQDYPEL